MYFKIRNIETINQNNQNLKTLVFFRCGLL